MKADRDPLIDVILPVRPRPPRLEQVLESLNAQDYQNWRLIALLDRDDGSNRSCIERLVVSHQIIFITCDYLDQSFPAMLNSGLAVSDAVYVARQDDDDISRPNRFRAQLNLFQKFPEVQVATGAATVVDINGRLLYRIGQPEKPEEICRSMLFENIVPHSSVMFRRAEVVKVGGYDEKIRGCEDYDLWLRVLSWDGIRSVNTEIVEVLNHENGMSRQRMQIRVVRKVNSSRAAACRRLGMPTRKGIAGSLVWSFKELAPTWIRRLAK